MEKIRVKGVLLYTNIGIRILSLKENGNLWSSEDCYRFCNNKKNSFDNKVHANKLVIKSILIDKSINMGQNWFKDINNFKETYIFINKPLH